MAINTMKVLGAAVAFAIAGQVSADGNRYDYDRYYQRETSVFEAYLAMEQSKDFNNVPCQAKPVLIDVRSLREYASGHPEDAYNVPYPTVSGLGGDAVQTPDKLYWEIHDIVKGDLDAPIMLLCRTGSRSVNAGNILANPDSAPSTFGLPSFTNVTNIWEGFVGQYRYAMTSNGEIIPTEKLDLDNDTNVDANSDGIDDDSADMYEQTKDANPDKDGWRNFAGLPWTTQIQQPLAYERNPGWYKALNLTPVQE
jgi:rhodanese-related sulfurtransferase